MKLKFNIGEKVKVKSDGEVGMVLSFHVDGEGVRYTISSKEVNLKQKKIIEGVKHVMEDELEAVDES